MAPIHGRVSRGGDTVLNRCRRRSGVRGMGGSHDQDRAGHAYTERVVDHRGTLLSYCLPARQPSAGGGIRFRE
jgi:hypothetical protein